MTKSLIGVIDTWGEFQPGYICSVDLAALVSEGIRSKGGVPFEMHN
ncbi:MAG: dihydroxy-acid dehydratase [Deltaproteobacteria bacterium]|nr:dihydroxy-acid dehydratase [Deltaproteobacteria bacterium]